MSLKGKERLEKTFEVILSETAVDSYASIFDQIEARWGKGVAIKFEGKVFKILETLSSNPLIFKAVGDHRAVRKGLIDKNCAFFYQVSELQIHILFFWDNRREPIFD